MSFCPSSEHGRFEYLRLSEESEKESRDEATQRGMEEHYLQRGSGWELFCIESGCWLVACGSRKIVILADLEAFADEASWAVDHFEYYQGEHERQSQQGEYYNNQA